MWHHTSHHHSLTLGWVSLIVMFAPRLTSSTHTSKWEKRQAHHNGVCDTHIHHKWHIQTHITHTETTTNTSENVQTKWNEDLGRKTHTCTYHTHTHTHANKTKHTYWVQHGVLCVVFVLCVVSVLCVVFVLCVCRCVCAYVLCAVCCVSLTYW